MSNKSKQAKVIKIAIFGDHQVGKTAFAVRYLTKRFIGDYDSDKEITYSHKVVLDKDEITLELLDTAQQTGEALLDHIKWADGFVLLLSVTDRQSAVKVQHFHTLICKSIMKPPGELPIMIAANKIDLIIARKVTETEIGELSAKMKRPVKEISVAEDSAAVTKVMEEVLHMVKREWARGPEKSVLNTVKQALKKKMYRSKSDTV